MVEQGARLEVPLNVRFHAFWLRIKEARGYGVEDNSRNGLESQEELVVLAMGGCCGGAAEGCCILMWESRRWVPSLGVSTRRPVHANLILQLLYLQPRRALLQVPFRSQKMGIQGAIQ